MKEESYKFDIEGELREDNLFIWVRDSLTCKDY